MFYMIVTEIILQILFSNQVFKKSNLKQITDTYAYVFVRHLQKVRLNYYCIIQSNILFRTVLF